MTPREHAVAASVLLSPRPAIGVGTPMRAPRTEDCELALAHALTALALVATEGETDHLERALGGTE